jgi:murein DD-endopeptidase MepM/ murein hydrolase activator NlpD
MTIGSVLLQPGKVAAPAAPPRAALLEDLLAVTVRIFWDRAHGGVCGERIETALANSLTRLRESTQKGEAAALQKMKDWVQPLVDRLNALGKALPADSAAHGAIESGDLLAGLIVDLLDGITTDALAKHLDFVLKVLQDDLGLTSTFIDQQIAAIFDEIVKQLRGAPPEADLAARENRFEMIALVKRIRREIAGQFTLPPVNVDRMAAPLLDQLRALDYDQFVTRIATAGKAVKSGLDVVEVISDEVNFSLGFSGGPGAAAPGASSKRAWYASWATGNEVQATDPATAPELAKFTFKHVDAGTMEKVTLHATWITTLLDGILEAVTQLKRGNYSITILSMIRDAMYTVLAPAADFNLPTVLDPWLKVPGSMDKLMNLVFALLCSLEGRSFNSYDGFLFLFRFIFKFGGSSLPVDKVRDAILSILTLVNHDPSVQPAAENRNNDGLIQLFMQILGPLLHAGVMPDNYFSINGEYGSLIAAVLLGALGMSVLSFFTGLLITAGLAGAWPDAGEAAKSWAIGWGLSHLNFIGFWFLLADGSTNGGKRGYIPDGGRGTEVAFDGYADNSTSPYLMPFAGSAECVQGNHGFWSHNSVISQVFSYDFSLNLGQDVLCMRDGVVVDTMTLDSVDDGDHPDDGNHIVIKHTTASADHDKDAGGAATTTYAKYYHGQKGSIAAAFGGTLPGPGTAVKQGQLLMKCNSTGMSRFNHIHVQVNGEKSGAPNNYTIPFVFKDAGDKGVPKSRTVYDSQNVKKP